jgi:peptide deformylase
LALRNIIVDDAEALRKKSREVVAFDERLHQLLDDLCETMKNSSGVGLAAVQVGVLKRVTVIDIGEGLIEFVNPVIIKQSKDTILDYEGCLSFPSHRGEVKRPKTVKVKALDRAGREFTTSGEGLLARAICHELDHMDGVIYADIADRMLSEEEIKRLDKKNKSQ